jgi:hypothetical protein
MGAATTTPGCQALLQAILTPDSADEQTLDIAGPPSVIGRCLIHGRQARNERSVTHIGLTDTTSSMPSNRRVRDEPPRGCFCFRSLGSPRPGHVRHSPRASALIRVGIDTGVRPGSRSVLPSPPWQRPFRRGRPRCCKYSTWAALPYVSAPASNLIETGDIRTAGIAGVDVHHRRLRRTASVALTLSASRPSRERFSIPDRPASRVIGRCSSERSQTSWSSLQPCR